MSNEKTTDWNSVLKGLVVAAQNGNPTAAKAVVDVARHLKSDAASKQHQKKMLQLEDDTLELCRYLGELGATRETVAHHLGRSMTENEEDAWRHGQRARQLELRAIELERVRIGLEKPSPWMK